MLSWKLCFYWFFHWNLSFSFTFCGFVSYNRKFITFFFLLLLIFMNTSIHLREFKLMYMRFNLFPSHQPVWCSAQKMPEISFPNFTIISMVYLYVQPEKMIWIAMKTLPYILLCHNIGKQMWYTHTQSIHEKRIQIFFFPVSSIWVAENAWINVFRVKFIFIILFNAKKGKNVKIN